MERPHFEPITWEPGFACKVSQLDKHRQKLIEIMNLMIDRYNERRCRDNITEPFFKLAFCLENFFADEEILLRRYNYPEFTMQKHRHKEVLARIVQFKDDFSEQKPTVCIDMLQYLSRWMQQEIICYKPDMIAFLKNKGVA